MNSNKQYKQAYVWIWLPEATTPIVAGKLELDNGRYFFNYGKSYLQSKNAISINDEELPLKNGLLPLLDDLTMPGCIRDSSPDAWGRRVIINKLIGGEKDRLSSIEIDELTYLLESGSDRIGALDFQNSPTEYIPRSSRNPSLEELLESAERVEKGIPLSPELDLAIQHGSSIGGARPKSFIENKEKKYIAKFSSSTDLFNIVKAEFMAMRLANLAGLNVANVALTSASRKDVLLIERFDRTLTEDGWQRKIMLSALTLFKLDEMMARYSSYENLAHIVRHKFTNASATLKELFSRLVFNILCGNTDDHARNHAAFWDGLNLILTPAYDICPQVRTGNVSSQAMLIKGTNNMSQLKLCLEAAPIFMLSQSQANAIIEQQIET
ncbi:MAG: type II toxin-antitoxin system HipA family toxin, partial [Legionella sp.]